MGIFTKLESEGKEDSDSKVIWHLERNMFFAEEKADRDRTEGL